VDITWVIVFVIGLFAGAVIGYFLRQLQIERHIKGRQAEADRILEEARARVREIELKTRDQALSIRDEAEADVSRRRAELAKEEDRLQRRRASLDKRFEQIEASR